MTDARKGALVQVDQLLWCLVYCTINYKIVSAEVHIHKLVWCWVYCTVNLSHAEVHIPPHTNWVWCWVYCTVNYCTVNYKFMTHAC